MSDTRPSTPEPSGVPVPTEQLAPPSAPAKRRSGPHAAAKRSMADMLVGTVLCERYRLVSKIGEGAMGWVFLAEHIEIHKKFAIKVLRPSLCRLREAVSRFKREARAATSIGSQHIVDVTDFGTTDTGAAFFVMEYLEGEDLSATILRDKQLPWGRVRAMMVQLCDALQAAHDAGIYHRDVKPANFYRVTRGDNEDFIKVLDFGIVRLANPTDSVVTQTGVVMGTPDFMAPEQALGRQVDHRADIYSLGATAYALLTGSPPFVGKTEYDVIYKQLNAEPKPPSELVDGLPDWAERLVLKAMRKAPEERYASMRELGAALRAGPDIAADPTLTSRPSPSKPDERESASGPQYTTRDGGPQRAVNPLIWGVGFVLVAVIGALIMVIMRSR